MQEMCLDGVGHIRDTRRMCTYQRGKRVRIRFVLAGRVFRLIASPDNLTIFCPTDVSRIPWCNVASRARRRHGVASLLDEGHEQPGSGVAHAGVRRARVSEGARSGAAAADRTQGRVLRRKTPVCQAPSVAGVCVCALLCVAATVLCPLKFVFQLRL